MRRAEYRLGSAPTISDHHLFKNTLNICVSKQTDNQR
jgi:hypothetical protein